MKEKNKLSTHIVGFRIHLERLGYSKTSVYMLPNCLKEFLAHQPHQQLQSITPEDIVRYHEYLQERPNKRTKGGLSESYINHHIYSLRLFFIFCLENGTLTECPMASLVFKTPVSKPREILTQEEVRDLYEVAETYKERAILSVFYGAGLRRTEGEKLNLKDIHFRTGILYVREGKGNKRRAVPINKSISKYFKDYIYKERFSVENERAFITNKTGTRSKGDFSNKILKTLLERAGITKIITLHSLRHSIATHLLESGLSVEYVRDFLGHKHLESTQIYTRVNLSKASNIIVE
jgi:integrase/recombinase XerD